MPRTALTALLASIATAIALVGADAVIDTPDELICSSPSCTYPLAGIELIVGDLITVEFNENPTVLFWLAESGPINRFEPPTEVDFEAPFEFDPELECGYVIDVMVILPIETEQDSGGVRRLLQAAVEC